MALVVDPLEITTEISEAAVNAKTWPFVEARKVIKNLKGKTGAETVIFETGYGPSGLPHIGTFGEVVRTTMVRHAFHVLTNNEIKSRLICFSDDMDGLRKVPTNVPNQDKLRNFLEMPLTKVPDPFEKFPSFGEHNNAMLRSFLDRFGFEYEFISSTDYYRSGKMDETKKKMLVHYDKLMEIMLPSLREERQATYSVFLPVCPRTGKVLQVPITKCDRDNWTVTYDDPETGESIVRSILGDQCKMQWKADWAMRWAALGVDYEMCGKDLTDTVKLSSRICRAIGNQPPEVFIYEMFLDHEGKKISKSKGNGLSVEEWMQYGTDESLALFMYNKPRVAKKLYFDVIPQNVDDYAHLLESYPEQSLHEQLDNPVWHIHSGSVKAHENPVSFSMMLNLVSASNSEDPSVLWGFLSRYNKGISPKTYPHLDVLVQKAIRYYKDFVAPNKSFRTATEQERKALLAFKRYLETEAQGHANDGVALQNNIYAIGKDQAFEPLRLWFLSLYQLLLGQDSGPRFGSFVALYGLQETIKLIDTALER